MAALTLAPLVLSGSGWADYTLVDSGAGRKLEAYGPHRFIRPEAQALWQPRLADWQADGEFVPGADEDGGGRWQFTHPVPRDGWPLSWQEVRFTAQCTPFRHLGFFPDMAPVWGWMGEMLAGRDDAATLNLFGYTGVGSLALSPYGPVTHVDASKKSVAQARANAELSGMDSRPIRWLVDDAAKFTAREVRRGRRYDGMSSLALAGLLAELFADLPGTIEHGDLAVAEQGAGGRLLPTAIFARWRNAGPGEQA